MDLEIEARRLMAARMARAIATRQSSGLGRLSWTHHRAPEGV
jgi:hypothetical protein